MLCLCRETHFFISFDACLKEELGPNNCLQDSISIAFGAQNKIQYIRLVYGHGTSPDGLQQSLSVTTNREQGGCLVLALAAARQAPSICDTRSIAQSAF